jgi:hypothetical protein
MLLSLMLLFVSCATATRPGADDAAEVKRFFLSGIDAFNRHDLEPFLAQFDPELQMYAAYEWLRDPAAIRERFRFTFATYPNVKMEIDDLRARSVAPDVVAVDFRFRTYPKGSGPAFHGIGSGVYVRRNGQWREVLEHETVTKIDDGAR